MTATREDLVDPRRADFLESALTADTSTGGDAWDLSVLAPVAAEGVTPGVGPSLLVVDDERGIRDLMRVELTREGFSVTTAENGEQALQRARERRFDLAITDLSMPGLDGAQTVSGLRAIQPQLEVVVVTAFATVDTAIRCMKAGAFDYLMKPFQIGKVVATLRRASEKAGMREAIELYDAARRAFSTFDRGRIVRLAIELTRRSLRADGVYVFVREGAEGELRMDPECGLDEAWCPDVASAAARAASTGHFELSTGGPRDATSAAPAAVLAMPLPGREAAAGALVAVRSAAASPFQAEEVERGVVLSTHIGMALENSRLFASLEVANERLKILDARRRSFLAVASHELRTPLTVIYGYLKLLQMEPAGAWQESHREAVSSAYANALRLMNYVNNLLEASHIESGRVVLRCVALPVGAIANQVVSHLRPILDHRKLDVSVEIPEDAAVHGDKAALEQVLTNLVSNAAKHAPRGSQIVVTAERAGDAWSVRVRDHGAGIDEATRAVLFSPFGQGALPEEQFQRGSGLGLLITRSLVQAMRGELTIGNHPQGGAVVEFRLPDSAGAAGSADPARAVAAA